MTETRRRVRLGGLEVTLERLTNGKTRVAVSLANSAIPGVATEVSDDAVLDVANQLNKFTKQGERQ